MKINLSLDSVQDEQLPLLNRIVDNLASTGYVVIDDLLNLEDAQKIKNRLLQLKGEDEFKKSGIGKAAMLQVNESIRGDFIRWMSGEYTNRHRT